MKWLFLDIAFVLYGILFCHLLILRNKHPNLKLGLDVLEMAAVPLAYSPLTSVGCLVVV